MDDASYRAARLQPKGKKKKKNTGAKKLRQLGKLMHEFLDAMPSQPPENRKRAASIGNIIGGLTGWFSPGQKRGKVKSGEMSGAPSFEVLQDGEGTSAQAQEVAAEEVAEEAEADDVGEDDDDDDDSVDDDPPADDDAKKKKEAAKNKDKFYIKRISLTNVSINEMHKNIFFSNLFTPIFSVLSSYNRDD